MAICPKCNKQELKPGEKLCPYCEEKKKQKLGRGGISLILLLVAAFLGWKK